MPKEAVYLTIFMQGGETSSLPHSITEESEIMRDDKVFYSVMSCLSVSLLKKYRKHLYEIFLILKVFYSSTG